MSFVSDRHKAIVHYVRTGDRRKVEALCRRYHIYMPTDDVAFAVGIYRTVQEVHRHAGVHQEDGRGEVQSAGFRAVSTRV